MNVQVWSGILLPFLGTSLGAAMVFALKDRISDGIQRMLTGFAAGVCMRMPKEEH
jgi:ZIP family zinc transporter